LFRLLGIAGLGDIDIPPLDGPVQRLKRVERLLEFFTFGPQTLDDGIRRYMRASLDQIKRRRQVFASQSADQDGELEKALFGDLWNLFVDDFTINHPDTVLDLVKKPAMRDQIMVIVAMTRHS